MFIEKREIDGGAKAPRRSMLPKLSAVLGLTAAVAFVGVIAVAPFTTTQASAEEYAPLSPGETLYQQLDTTPVDATTIAIEDFEFEVVAEPKAAGATGGASAPAAGTPDPGTAQAIALGYVGAGAEFDCLVALWNRESHWNVYSNNTSSGAYGIPQALPGSKMASAGADWATNPDTQIRWGLGYIMGRYGSPCNAWGHSQSVGWY